MVTPFQIATAVCNRRTTTGRILARRTPQRARFAHDAELVRAEPRILRSLIIGHSETGLDACVGFVAIAFFDQKGHDINYYYFHIFGSH